VYFKETMASLGWGVVACHFVKLPKNNFQISQKQFTFPTPNGKCLSSQKVPMVHAHACTEGGWRILFCNFRPLVHSHTHVSMEANLSFYNFLPFGEFIRTYRGKLISFRKCIRTRPDPSSFTPNKVPRDIGHSPNLGPFSA
jgi:hypothetical protein